MMALIDRNIQATLLQLGLFVLSNVVIVGKKGFLELLAE
jgi:hypothetical protein